MRHAYVTKRIAPEGYVAVTRKLAELLYSDGYSVTVCGNNVTSFHVFDGWHLGCTVQRDILDDKSFDVLLNSFMFYLDSELGTYPVFYVKQEVMNNIDLSIL